MNNRKIIWLFLGVVLGSLSFAISKKFSSYNSENKELSLNRPVDKIAAANLNSQPTSIDKTKFLAQNFPVVLGASSSENATESSRLENTH